MQSNKGDEEDEEAGEDRGPNKYLLCNAITKGWELIETMDLVSV